MSTRMTRPAAYILSMCLVLTVLVLVTGFSIAQTRDVSTPWDEVAKLTALDGVAFDRFGVSVSISGGTVIVGATGDQYHRKGSAYVFERDEDRLGEWGQVAKLTASDGGVTDYFGYSVSISADTVAVGAPYDNDDGEDSGSVYLFEKQEDDWTDMVDTVKLTASDGAEGDRFGLSVSIGGDTLVVGAYEQNDEDYYSGSAYLFERDLLGNWAQVAKLTTSDGVGADCFGCSVSISGDIVVVGAPYDNDSGDYSGSAFLFEKPEGGWTDMVETAKLTAADGGEGDAFGRSVSISGDTVAVGATFNDAHGSAYLFDWDADSIGTKEIAKLAASDGVPSDYFGWSVSISGDTVAVGAYGDDDNGEDSGSAYLFAGFETVVWVYLPMVLRAGP